MERRHQVDRSQNQVIYWARLATGRTFGVSACGPGPRSTLRAREDGGLENSAFRRPLWLVRRTRAPVSAAQVAPQQSAMLSITVFATGEASFSASRHAIGGVFCCSCRCCSLTCLRVNPLISKPAQCDAARSNSRRDGCRLGRCGGRPRPAIVAPGARPAGPPRPSEALSKNPMAIMPCGPLWRSFPPRFLAA